jgi:hypothetical protein
MPIERLVNALNDSDIKLPCRFSCARRDSQIFERDTVPVS